VHLFALKQNTMLPLPQAVAVLVRHDVGIVMCGSDGSIQEKLAIK